MPQSSRHDVAVGPDVTRPVVVMPWATPQRSSIGPWRPDWDPGTPLRRLQRVPTFTGRRFGAAGIDGAVSSGPGRGRRRNRGRSQVLGVTSRLDRCDAAANSSWHRCCRRPDGLVCPRRRANVIAIVVLTARSRGCVAVRPKVLVGAGVELRVSDDEAPFEGAMHHAHEVALSSVVDAADDDGRAEIVGGVNHEPDELWTLGFRGICQVRARGHHVVGKVAESASASEVPGSSVPSPPRVGPEGVLRDRRLLGGSGPEDSG